MDTNFLLEALKNLAMFSPVGVITWFFTKRHFQKPELKRANAEADGSQSDVIVKNLEIYQRMLDDIAMRKDNEIKDLLTKILLLESKILELEEIILKLEEEIKKIK